MSGEESKTGVAGLCSPVVQEDGSVLVVSSATGGVLAYNDAGELTELFNTGGQPTGAAIGPKGAVFLADVAHGAVIKRGASDGEAKPQAVVVDYEGKPFQVRVLLRGDLDPGCQKWPLTCGAVPVVVCRALAASRLTTTAPCTSLIAAPSAKRRCKTRRVQSSTSRAPSQHRS